MNALVESILRLGSRDVESEEAACAALVALRFPRGVACPCGASCTRHLPAYLDEALARWRIREEVCAWLVARIIGVEAALTFRVVRDRFRW
jgi:hypothetical protein